MIWLFPLLVLLAIFLVGWRRVSWVVKNPGKALLAFLVVFVGSESALWLLTRTETEPGSMQLLALGGLLLILVWVGWPYLKNGRRT